MNWETRHAIYAHELKRIKARSVWIDRAAVAVSYVLIVGVATVALVGWWAGL